MIPSMPPAVDIKWDFIAYHARPTKWVDKGEIRRLALLAKKAEEERMLAMTGDATIAGLNNESNRNDDAWEAAVAAAAT
jgi:hypothetical protein